MKSLQRLRSCLSTSSPAAIRKNRSNFATLMTWLVFFLLDSAAAIMASDSSARWCRESAELPLTAVRFSLFFCWGKTIYSPQGTVADPVPTVTRRREFSRWQQPLFMLFRTIASTTGSCAATLATSSATTPPAKPPSGSPRQSRNSARPNSSFTFLTGEQPAGASRRGGSPDCSGDDRTQSASSLLHLSDALASFFFRIMSWNWSRSVRASTRDGTPASTAAMTTVSALVMQSLLIVMRRAIVLAEGTLCSCCLLTASDRRRRVVHSPTERRDPRNPRACKRRQSSAPLRQPPLHWPSRNR